MVKSYDVYALGNALVDIQVRVSEEKITKLGLAKGEMRLVSLDEQQNLLAEVESQDCTKCSGGSAANTVIAIAQLGGRAAFGCRLGKDSNGNFYANEMRQIGVDLQAPLVPAQTTGTCAVLITPDGQRTMNTFLGASSAVCPDDVVIEQVEKAKWLYIEGYLFSSAQGPQAIEKALEIAKASNTKVAVTCSDGFVIDLFGDILLKTLKQADLVFANEEEAKRLTGRGSGEEAFASLRNIVPNVVMTRGGEGVNVCFNGAFDLVPANTVSVVDTTGAGDMFAGAFLYGVSKKLSARTSAELGNYLAGCVVSQMGARLSGDVRSMPQVKSILGE